MPQEFIGKKTPKPNWRLDEKLANKCTTFFCLTTFWSLLRKRGKHSQDFFTTHYYKSQIFVQKFIFDKKPTFSRDFHPKFFWQFFSWNQSCQQLISPKPQHFHEFFTPKKSTIFSENQSWIIGQKMKISNSVQKCFNFVLVMELSKWWTTVPAT